MWKRRGELRAEINSCGDFGGSLHHRKYSENGKKPPFNNFVDNGTSENLSSVNIWTWISGFMFTCFLLKICVEILAWGRLPLCTQRWITAVLLARFHPSCTQFHCLFFWMSTSFDLDPFSWISEWWSLFRDLPYPLSIDRQSNPFRVQGVTQKYSTKGFCAELMHSTFVFWWCDPNGIFGPSTSELNQRSQVVWPSACRSCTFRR